MKHAASLLHVSLGIVKAARRECPEAFDSHNRVDLPTLRKWLHEAGGANAKLNPKEQAELRIFLADAVFKEQRNEIQAGRYTKNEVFIEALDDLANEQRTILRQKLENEYPAVVAGLEPAQARVYGRRVVDEVFRLIAGLAERFRRKLEGRNPKSGRRPKSE